MAIEQYQCKCDLCEKKREAEQAEARLKAAADKAIKTGSTEDYHKWWNMRIEQG